MKKVFKGIGLLVLMAIMFLPMTSLAQTPNMDGLERDWKVGRTKVKVMSYNVFQGFYKRADKDRMDRFVAWVKEQSPDVLAMQELSGFTETQLKEFALRYGHPYAVILKEYGNAVGFTSKTPIKVVAKNLQGFGQGLLHCEILGIDFLSTHLNPYKNSIRLQEARNIVDYIEKNKLTRCVLMGDLNARSPFDASWNDTSLDIYAPLSALMSAPLHDICFMFTPDEKRYTFPTRILVNAPKGDGFGRKKERLDFIFCTDALRSSFVDAQIYNGADTDYLSDHYPVSASLLLDDKALHTSAK